MAQAQALDGFEVLLIAERDVPVNCAKGMRVLPHATTTDCGRPRRAARAGRNGNPAGS